MIRIHKTKPIPSKLSSDGVNKAAAHQAEFEANPNGYSATDSRRKFDFDQNIYGHASVKEQLILDQHEKCCFCEGKFKDHAPGDVEHFRPKSAYVKRDETTLNYPGYYWLAYDWNNLLFSCQICNGSYKRNHFPLMDESVRAKNHLNAHLVEAEKPLLVNPLDVNENPDQHLAFAGEIVRPVKGSAKGQITIEIFGLDRLNDARLEHLEVLYALSALWDADEENDEELSRLATDLKRNKRDLKRSIQLAKKVRDSAATPQGKFSACVRANFPKLPTS